MSRGKHATQKNGRFNFPFALLSRRRAILSVLFWLLTILFVSHSWITLSIIFGILASIEMFLAVETAGAEGAFGKEQEMAIAGMTKLINSGSETPSIHSLFGSKHTKEEETDAVAPSTPISGYL